MTMVNTNDHAPSQEEQDAFNERLAMATAEEAKVPVRTVNGKPIAWSPQHGSQNEFLRNPVFEVLYHGTRGPGKTDALLMAFAQHVGKGHGAAWAGIIFRQSYPQLADVQAKSEKWFRLIFPEAKFNRSKMLWEWPTGERLLLRHMARREDYWNYHGHEYPFIGWEELTNWADDACFKSMFSCCRSSKQGVPRMVRATCNPYGVGHNWVKDRYRLFINTHRTIAITDAVDVDGRPEPFRCAIHGNVKENLILLKADPNYIQTVIASAANPGMAKAWIEGSWDIVAGGMFDDVWKAEFNVVKRFAVPLSWRIDRSFDWGSSAPFSVGWWAESDGSDLRFADGSYTSTVRGDLFRIKEWYGWNGQPNKGVQALATDIALGIVERELSWGLRDINDPNAPLRVKPGPADSSIFTTENGVSIGTDMEKRVRVGNHLQKGVYWTRADKRPGSRKVGWEQIRKMMKAAHREGNLPREKPGLFVIGDECTQFLRTMLTLPRSEKDLDDVDTAAEDHIGDEVRYRVRSSGTGVVQGTHVGMQ